MCLGQYLQKITDLNGQAYPMKKEFSVDSHHSFIILFIWSFGQNLIEAVGRVYFW